MALMELPAEILVNVLLNLDFQSMFSCQRVNRSLHDLYQSSATLQYHVECEIAGVLDNPNCTLPIKTRLQMLRDRESAWASLQPRHSKTLPLVPAGVETLEVSGEYCFVERREPGSDTSFSLLSHPILPANAPIEQNESWSELRVEGLIGFATCLEEHDLVACFVGRELLKDCFDYRILLFQHTTGKPHPLATETDFAVFQASLPIGEVVVEIQVVGENLVLSFGAPLRIFYFYDWRTGVRKSELQHFNQHHFAFLRDDLFCYPDLEGHSLRIYHIPASSDGNPTRCIQVLAFPDETDLGIWDKIEARSSPNPTLYGLPPRHASPRRPFLERPERAIILFEFYSYGGEIPSFLIVHRMTLLDILPPQEHWLHDEVQCLTWSEWGPKTSQIFEKLLQCEITEDTPAGQRCIGYHPPDPSTTFRIIDFNPYRVRKAQSHNPVVREGSLLYSVTKSPEGEAYDDLLFSDTGLATVNVSGNSKSALINVLHFG